MENEAPLIKEPCPIDNGVFVFWCQKKGYNLYRCKTCHFGCIRPLPFSSTLEEMYGADYFSGAELGFGYTDYEADKEPQRPTLEKYLKDLKRFLPSGGHLLDIGAANGFFVGVAQAKGWNAEGVEISASAVADAVERNRSVKQGSIEDVQGTERFDVISFLDVLEHIPDPKKALRHAFSLLRPGGALLVNVPDAGSLIAKMFGLHWHAIIPPEHINYFSPKNLKLLSESIGFKVVLQKHYAKSFRLGYALHIVRRNIGWKFLGGVIDRLAASHLANIVLPLPILDNLTMIAIKPLPVAQPIFAGATGTMLAE